MDTLYTILIQNMICLKCVHRPTCVNGVYISAIKGNRPCGGLETSTSSTCDWPALEASFQGVSSVSSICWNWEWTWNFMLIECRQLHHVVGCFHCEKSVHSTPFLFPLKTTLRNKKRGWNLKLNNEYWYC